MTYESSYGRAKGLPERLRVHIDRMRQDRALPWLGTGIIDDLELIMKFLNLREYGEFLRAKGAPDYCEFGDQIIELCESEADNEALLEHIDETIGTNKGETYHDAVKRGADALETVEELRDLLDVPDDKSLGDMVDAMRDQSKEIRDALVVAGALDDDDTETEIPDLIRALLC